MASDIVRCPGRKKHGSTLQIVVIAEAAQRDLTQENFPVSFDYHLRHVGWEPSRRDSVHLDVVNSPLARQIVCESDDTTFACVITDSLKFRRGAAAPSARSAVVHFPPPPLPPLFPNAPLQT